MNYRHIYHAGNFADVLKHAALVAVLLHLRKKATPFAVIDTHAGRGLYDIMGSEAGKTGEAQNGISRLLSAGTLPGVLASYGDIVRSFGEKLYPGSPLIARNLLRPQDRLVAVETQQAECRALAAALAGTKSARALCGDGYRELRNLLPPPERRGLVLIDPPYEAGDEFPTATRAQIDAYGRFPTGIFLFWYPVKRRPAVAASIGELLNAGVSSLLRLELDIGADGKAEPGRGQRLSAAGLLAVNPPFGFARDMEAAARFLAEHLAQGPDARATIEVLADR